MQLQTLLPVLASNRECIKALAQAHTEEQARYKPGGDSWSVLEVINHLFDEEKEDFRRRLRTLLLEPDRPLPPINPEAWVRDREYNQRDLDKSLNNFLAERQRSLQWLQSLSSPDWDAAYTTNSFSIRAGDIMVSWVAHDQLHIRQLVEIQRQLLIQTSEPYQIDYAGDW